MKTNMEVKSQINNQFSKINLGCGEKLLPMSQGWLNVDVVKPASIVLDTVSEVSGFPFSDKELSDKTEFLFHEADILNMKSIANGSIYEIHAYHVVEHFFVNELPQFFAEVRRVLHPEHGVIVLEQPDVIKCAKNLLQIEASGDPMLWHHMGLKGFFGDGSSDRPYMGHKWGWWPASLADVLTKCGFKAVVQQPAQTHAGDKRDFRLLAFMDKMPPAEVLNAGIQKAQQPANHTGLFVNNGGNQQPLLISPHDSVPDVKLLEHIQENLNTIPTYLNTRYAVHGGTAFILSAGPSLEGHIDEVKRRKQPGDAVFCVKHALPTLLAKGLIPDYCVILDPRPLEGTSTHGVTRKNLYEIIPANTTFLVASMTDVSTVRYLVERKAKIVGWNAMASGIDKFLARCPLLIQGGTSAGIRSIDIAKNLGFRKVVLVGYDSSIDQSWAPTEQDLNTPDEYGRRKYLNVKYKNGPDRFSTGELMAQAQDLVGIFQTLVGIMDIEVLEGGVCSDIFKEYEGHYKIPSYKPL